MRRSRHTSGETLLPTTNLPAMGTQEISAWLHARLAARVSFDMSCVGALDPMTGLVASTESDVLVERAFAYVEAEYRVTDVNKIEWLAQQPDPVGVLSAATGGDPGRSYRYRRLLEPAGMVHELRAALVVDRHCWGYLMLLRTPDRPDFTPAEATLVRGVAPRLAAALRAYTLEAAAMRGGRATGTAADPGVAVLDADGRLEAANDVAQAWMDELAHSHPSGALHPPIPVATLAAAVAQGGPATRRALAHAHPSGWVVLRGSRLPGPPGATGGRVVVSMDPAEPLTVAPLLLHARGLTDRETRVALSVLRGLSTAEIADELHISRYTVQDHLKATFAKTEVSSRRELVRALFPALSPAEVMSNAWPPEGPDGLFGSRHTPDLRG